MNQLMESLWKDKGSKCWREGAPFLLYLSITSDMQISFSDFFFFFPPAYQHALSNVKAGWSHCLQLHLAARVQF